MYTLDQGTMGWSRLGTERSGKIRREFGTLVTWPVIEVGMSVALHDNKVLPGHQAHFVYTSPVVEVSE